MGLQMRTDPSKPTGQPAPESKPIMEINPAHPRLEKLDQEQDEARFSDLSQFLFDQGGTRCGESLRSGALCTPG